MSPAAQNPAIGDFSGRVGDSFAVPVGGHRLMLTLEAAQELHGSLRDAGGFRLEFLGPADPMLVQGIFPFEIEGDRYDLFIVPIGRDDRGSRYEAVFY
ncbi:MAG TPA: hypothetical protein VK614_00250 [Allosphingosinicella sp.]|nr:hypothetical protein [Allosphingosinicella sp.]